MAFSVDEIAAMPEEGIITKISIDDIRAIPAKELRRFIDGLPPDEYKKVREKAYDYLMGRFETAGLKCSYASPSFLDGAVADFVAYLVSIKGISFGNVIQRPPDSS